MAQPQYALRRVSESSVRQAVLIDCAPQARASMPVAWLSNNFLRSS